MARTSFILPDEVDEAVEDRLTYGQSKASWYRYASETVIELEPILDELYDLHQFEERQEFVVAAVKRAVDEEMEMDEIRGHTRRIEDLDTEQ